MNRFSPRSFPRPQALLATHLEEVQWKPEGGAFPAASTTQHAGEEWPEDRPSRYRRLDLLALAGYLGPPPSSSRGKNRLPTPVEHRLRDPEHAQRGSFVS